MKHAFLLWLSVYAGRFALLALCLPYIGLDRQRGHRIQNRLQIEISRVFSLSWSKLKQIKALELNSKLSWKHKARLNERPVLSFQYTFGTDPVTSLLEPLEEELLKTTHTYCGKSHTLFTKRLRNSVAKINRKTRERWRTWRTMTGHGLYGWWAFARNWSRTCWSWKPKHKKKKKSNEWNFVISCLSWGSWASLRLRLMTAQLL